MKVNYRGFEIEATRERCNAGYLLLYYTVFRVSDRWKMIDDSKDTSDSVQNTIKMLKDRVDYYYEHPEEYEEEEI